MNFFKVKTIFISILITNIWLWCSFCFGCDLSKPDKIKHIQYSQKATIIGKKIIGIPMIVVKPIKWLFNSKIQKIFPDNYIPPAISGSFVFCAGLLKEMPYDAIGPGDCSYCDIVANIEGIKKGVKK